jgi:hypothetical protein
MEHNSSLVNLSIPENVTKPIIAAKIQEAVIVALGGQEKIVAGVIHQICNTRVNSEGKVDSYSSNNNQNWLDYHVTTIIQKEVKEALVKQIAISADQIKEELVKQLMTKKGASKVAEALLSSLNGTFQSSWMSKFEIKFEERK